MHNAIFKKVQRDALGILLMFLGAFFLLALISYHHSDPSFLSHTKRIPLNYAGRMGANLAEALIQLMGIGSYIFCSLFLFGSFKILKGEKYSKIGIDSLLQIIATFAVSSFLSLQMGSIRYGEAIIPSGGMIGAWIASSALRYLNSLGATLFLLCILLISLIVSTPLSLDNLLKFSKYLSQKNFYYGKYFIEKVLNYLNNLKHKDKHKDHVIFNEITPPTIDNPSPFLEIKNIIKKSLTSQHNPSYKPGQFTLPSLSFLDEPPVIKGELDKNKLVENSKILETKLIDFGIEGQVVAVRPGPVITMYEFKPGPGVKISQIATLADDLSLALSAQSVRIVAPIPGKNVVGIEIPNEQREKVYLREILGTSEFQENTSGIPLAIGKDIFGSPVVADLSRMPHLLIAGAPGSGKSVFINSLICSLLYKFTPHEMRLIMVDPKQLELNLYENIPHLLLPMVDDPKKASTALKWTVHEMERRYKIMAKSAVRHVSGFNEKLEKEGVEKMRTLLCPEDTEKMPDPNSLTHLLDHDDKGNPRVEKLPFILVIIDEFADLMMVAPKDVELSVTRLAQKARAAGIHLLVATQRPSVDVITGLIKANLPSRVSFQVATKVDSRTIVDSIGAEKLVGLGDMLFVPPGLSRLVRLHGAYIHETEIQKLCDHWRSQGAPVYQEKILVEPEEQEEVEQADGAADELYQQATTIVRELGQASASMLQRRLKIGYNRAARMVEAMETQGIVGPADGAKPREVIY